MAQSILVQHNSETVKSRVRDVNYPDIDMPDPYTFIFYEDRFLLFPGLIPVYKKNEPFEYQQYGNNGSLAAQIIKFPDTKRTLIARSDASISSQYIFPVEQIISSDLDTRIMNWKSKAHNCEQSFSLLEHIDVNRKFVIFDSLYVQNDNGFYVLRNREVHFSDHLSTDAF